MDDALHLQVAAVACGLAPGVLGATGPATQLVLQGCRIGCPGCTSLHTHAAMGGRQMTVAVLLQLMHRLHGQGQLARLTLTGGEPTEQAPALERLLASFTQAFPQTEVVLYSGRSWRALQRHFAPLVAHCDVVVAGPFVSDRPPTPMAGSDNQTVHLLTPRAERLYRDWQRWPMHRVQLSVTPVPDGMQQMLMVGIPQRQVAQVMNGPKACTAAAVATSTKSP